MRLSITLLFAASVSAALVGRQSLPSCAQKCLMSADFDTCQPTDNGCLCRNDKFLTSSTLCIGQTCEGNDLQEALAAAQGICAAVGVTLTSTPAGFPTGTASTGAPAGSATAPSGSGTPSGSSTPSGSGAPPGSGTATGASTPTSTGNAASVNSVHALAGFAALGVAALIL